MIELYLKYGRVIRPFPLLKSFLSFFLRLMKLGSYLIFCFLTYLYQISVFQTSFLVAFSSLKHSEYSVPLIRVSCIDSKFVLIIALVRWLGTILTCIYIRLAWERDVFSSPEKNWIKPLIFLCLWNQYACVSIYPDTLLYAFWR